MVYTKEDRQTFLIQLANEFGGHYKPQPTSFSSSGYVDYGGFKLIAKPEKGAGAKAAGIDNEDALINQLNHYTSQHTQLNITFKSAHMKYHVKDVVVTESVGTDTKNRKKADVTITTRDGKKVPISVKKDKAEMWESADRYWSSNTTNTIKHLLSKGDIKMEDKDGIYKIAPAVGIEATPEEKRAVVFGSDIEGQGCVVQKTFSPGDFSYCFKSNELTVDVSHIIEKQEDIKGSHDVWFMIRSDCTRRSVPDYPGIRTLAVYESRMTKKVKRYNRGDIPL